MFTEATVVDNPNMEKVLIRDSHICKACNVPKTFEKFEEFTEHINLQHGIKSIRSYTTNFGLKLRHDFPVKTKVQIGRIKIRKLVTKKKEVKLAPLSGKPIYKVGEELVKRVYIGITESYQRMIRKNAKVKGSLKIGGLSKEDLAYVPELDEKLISLKNNTTMQSRQLQMKDLRRYF
jgi:hypothetical protein